MSSVVRLDIESVKLSRDAIPVSSSSSRVKPRAFLVARYLEQQSGNEVDVEEDDDDELQEGGKSVIAKSSDSKLCAGSSYTLPWNEECRLISLRLQVFVLQSGLSTRDVGQALWMQQSSDVVEEKTKEMLTDMASALTMEVGNRIGLSLQDQQEVASKASKTVAFGKGGREQMALSLDIMSGYTRVGKLKGKLSIRKAGATSGAAGAEYKEGEGNRAPTVAVDVESLPEFTFSKLDRKVNWDRIHGLNLDSIMHRNDVRALLSCEADMSRGDISQEDVDPEMRQAVLLAQLSSQYLLGCHNLLKNREKLLQGAMRKVEDEEQVVNIQLAKCKARDKALRRESRKLDSLRLEYVGLLDSLDPDILFEFEQSKQERARREELAMHREQAAKKRSKLVTDKAVPVSRRDVRNSDSSDSEAEATADEEKEHEPGTPQRKTWANASPPKKESSPVRAFDLDESQNNEPNLMNVSSSVHQPLALQELVDDDVEDDQGVEDMEPLAVEKKRSVTISWELQGRRGVTNNGKEEGSEEEEDDEEDLPKPWLLKSKDATAAVVDPLPSLSPTYSDEVDDGKVQISTNFESSRGPVSTTRASLMSVQSSTAMSVDSLAPAPAATHQQQEQHQPLLAPTEDLVAPALPAVPKSLESKEWVSKARVNQIREEDVVQEFFTDDDSSILSLTPIATKTTSSTTTTSKGKQNEEDLLDEDDLNIAAATGIVAPTVSEQHQEEPPVQMPLVPSTKHLEEVLEEFDDSQNYFDDVSKTGSDKSSSRSRATSTVGVATEEDHGKGGALEVLGEEEEKPASVHVAESKRPPLPYNISGHKLDASFENKWDPDVVRAGHGVLGRHEQLLEHEDVFERSGADSDYTGSISFGQDKFDFDMFADHESSAVVDLYGHNTARVPVRDSKALGVAGGGDGDGDVGMRTGVMRFLQKQQLAKDDATRADSPDGDFLMGSSRGGALAGGRSNADEDDVLFGTGVYGGENLAGTGSTMASSLDFGGGAFESSIGKQNAEREEQEEEEESTSIACWRDGRATQEALEKAEALDVFISAVTLEPKTASLAAQIKVQVSFLRVLSAPSRPISTSARPGSAVVQPLNYAAHMRFDRALAEALADEIQIEEENLHLAILFIDTQTGKTIGKAAVNVYFMLEDACNILRQEVDVFGDDRNSSNAIASAVVDIRGHQVLRKYS